MKKISMTISTLSALIVLGMAGIAGTASAQAPQSGQKPMFAHPVPHFDATLPPATALTTWNGSFMYQGKTNNFVMVGTDPSSTDTTTTFPVFIIPVKMVFTSGTKKKAFDPRTVLPSGNTVIQQILDSPIFESSIDYVQGGTDLGMTQYEDAFQRGNFWTDVTTNTNYHAAFGTPTVLPLLTVDVTSVQGAVGRSSFGPPENIGIFSFGDFESLAPGWIAQYPSITPNSFPIFVTYNVYLSETNNFSGCCIGGYHDAYGSPSSPQTYAQFSFMDQSTRVSVFSSDVSALSHEAGEWYDDPYIDNTQGACGGILEVGDPLEGEADYGDHIYTVGGYDYHIQDLTFLKYFGQTPSTSVNDWWTFQNFPFTTVCQNGQ
jgi:hypothetical protein